MCCILFELYLSTCTDLRNILQSVFSTYASTRRDRSNLLDLFESRGHSLNYLTVKIRFEVWRPDTKDSDLDLGVTVRIKVSSSDLPVEIKSRFRNQSQYWALDRKPSFLAIFRPCRKSQGRSPSRGFEKMLRSRSRKKVKSPLQPR